MRLATVTQSRGGDDGARPDGWRAELRAAVRTVDELAARIALEPDELAGARRAEARGLPLLVTPHYLGLADPRDPRCPIRRQIVPRIDEAREVPGDLVDPLGERAHEVAPMLVRRYPDRALLLVTDQCAVYCRFCTRSRMVGGGVGPAPLAALEPALAWLAAHSEVRELILSGGDPLVLGTERLVRLLERVRAVEHIEVVRLATRVPVVLPSRVTERLARALRAFHPLWVMTHFNHPKELTPEAERACAVLVDAGLPVMNQTVLLAGVNDDAAVLARLFRGLVRWRVRPYYLLQMDPVRGSAHLRTPLARGIAIMEALQGTLSGIALPRLVVDTPGGMGKVPVGPDYVVARAPGRTTLRTHRGVHVDYVDPPDREGGTAGSPR
jgi:lysine 2,3-aminomutase